MHLQTKGEIKINVAKIAANKIKITIEDNGVGRTKAAELKSRTNNNISHGLDITKERIAKLHPKNCIQILDKVDERLNGIGTVVVIELYL
jgi:nitrate/nitrite-specific signal transduction histidine kinase